MVELAADIVFAVDIVLTFFKAHTDNPTLKKNALEYIKGFFIFDLASCMPGLCTLESRRVYYVKLVRLVHWQRFFATLNIIFEKVLVSCLGYHRQKIQDIVEFVKLLIFVLYATHNMACIWVFIGNQGPQYWMALEGFKIEDGIFVYIHAFYFVMTTVTTVGYGDIGGTQTSEYLFCMAIEFVGLSFFSFLMGSINQLVSVSTSFDQIINQHLENLDIWLRKLEQSSP